MSQLSAKKYIFHRLDGFMLKEFIQKLDILTSRQKTIAELREFMEELGITWPINQPQLY